MCNDQSVGLFLELAGHIRVFLFCLFSQGQNLLFTIVASPHICIYVCLIEVPCVVILCSKLLPTFWLEFQFLHRKHILIVLFSACVVMVLNKQQLLLLAAQILLEFIQQNNLLILQYWCACWVFISLAVAALAKGVKEYFKEGEDTSAASPYLFCVWKRKIICVVKVCAMIDIKITKHVFFTTLSENRVPQSQTRRTCVVCLARPKVCPTDIIHPHAAQLMIDTTVDQFFLLNKNMAQCGLALILWVYLCERRVAHII